MEAFNIIDYSWYRGGNLEKKWMCIESYECEMKTPKPDQIDQLIFLKELTHMLLFLTLYFQLVSNHSD